MFEEQVVKLLATAGIRTNAEKLEVPPQDEYLNDKFKMVL